MSKNGEPQVMMEIVTDPVDLAKAHALRERFDRSSPRFWTCHWQNRYWRPDVNREHAPVRGSGSNSFHKRGVSPGDTVYVISLLDGQLLLGGKTIVDQIVSREDAVRIFDSDDLFDAQEWVIGRKESGSPLNLHRQLAAAVSRRLLFRSSKRRTRGLFFLTDERLDPQATRGVHELTSESAEFLDQIIKVTDSLPRSGQTLVVTEELLTINASSSPREAPTPRQDSSRETTYEEGDVQRVLVDRYERDPRAREACIQHYGATCFLCGFDFARVYGDLMSGFIHVHHLESLATVGPGYQVDPVRDLRPVCPNCHAVLHHQDPPYSLDDVRRLLEIRRRTSFAD